MNIEIEGEKTLELREDELICPVCKGAGHTKKSIYVCEKCDGIGKVDWVTNAMIRKKKERSSLDEINVRRVVMHIKSFVDKLQFEPNDKITADHLRGTMENYLDTMQSRKAIYDYNIIQSPDNHLTVHIKPNRSIEIVQMDLTIIA